MDPNNDVSMDMDKGSLVDPNMGMGFDSPFGTGTGAFSSTSTFGEGSSE